MRTRIIDYLIKLDKKSGIFLRENKDHRLSYKIRIKSGILVLCENKDHRLPYKIRIKNLESFCVRTRIIDYLIKLGFFKIWNLSAFSEQGSSIT